MKLVRNASPFWNVLWVSKDKIGASLPKDSAFSILGSFGMMRHYTKHDDMPPELKRKISEIRWVKTIKGASKAFVTFSRLGYEDLTTNMLKQGSCFIIFAGWWDFFGTGDNVSRVFDGMCSKTKWKYDQSGFSVTLELSQVGAMSLGAIYNETKVGLTKAKNIFEALGAISDYLDVSLAIGFEKYPTRIDELKIESEKNKGWWLLPNKPPNPDKGERPRILSDVLDNLAKKAVCTWFIQDNILYFGRDDFARSGDIRKIEKFFKFRTGHQDLSISSLQTLNHLEDDTFDSVEVNDPLYHPGNSLVIPSNDKKAKKPNTKNSKKPRTVKAYLAGAGSWGESSIRPDWILRREAAGLYVQADRINAANEQLLAYETADIKDADAVNFYLNTPGKTKDIQDIQTKGFTQGVMENTQSTIKIVGAMGDPRLIPGDLFMFEGLPQHTDEWYVESAESYIVVGSYYKMDINGVRRFFSGLQNMPPKAQKQVAAAKKAQALTKIKFFGSGAMEASAREKMKIELEAGSKYKQKNNY